MFIIVQMSGKVDTSEDSACFIRAAGEQLGTYAAVGKHRELDLEDALLALPTTETEDGRSEAGI